LQNAGPPHGFGGGGGVLKEAFQFGHHFL
jgi:hypothetical protein